jgi:hypothetical protein
MNQQFSTEKEKKMSVQFDEKTAARVKMRLTEIEEMAGVALFELLCGFGDEYYDADGKLTTAGEVAEDILGMIRSVYDEIEPPS